MIVDLYRACAICDHGKGPHCRNPTVVGQKTRPVEECRRHGGPCGPEATHLNFPGLQHDDRRRVAIRLDPHTASGLA